MLLLAAARQATRRLRDGALPHAGDAARAALLTLPLVLRLGEAARSGGFAHVVLPQEWAALAVAAALCLWALFGRALAPKGVVHQVLLALVALEAVSVVASGNPFIGVRVWSLSLAAVAVFCVGCSVGRLSLWTALPGVIVAGSVVLEAARVVPRMSALGHAPGGVLAERNLAAEYIVLTLPLLAYWVVRGRRFGAGVASAAISVAACAIICCRTRSAWLALAALALWGLCSLLVWRSDRVRPWRVGLLALAVVAGVVAAPWVSALHWRSRAPFVDSLTHLLDAQSPSGAGRLVQYATTLRMAEAHPLLGVGPGNWAGQYPSFAAFDDPTLQFGLWPVTRLPNSDVLGFVAERGVLGALLAALCLVLLWRAQGATYLRRSLLVAWAVVGSFDAVLQSPGPLLWFAFVLGASCPAVQQTTAAQQTQTTEPQRTATSTPHTAPRAPVFGMASVHWLGMAVALAVLSVLGLRRIAAFSLALHPKGTEQLERATELDPGLVALRLQTAYDWIEQRRCDLARPHLEMVARAAPEHPMRSKLAARCPTN